MHTGSCAPRLPITFLCICMYVYDVVNPYLMFAQSYFIQILRIPSQCWALRAYLRIFVGHICGIPTQRVGAIYLCM